MKKIILAAVAVFAFGSANAQDFKSKRGENFLPEAGDWAISFQAKPFLNFVGGVLGGRAVSPDSNSPIEGSFVGKKFITDKSAYRVVANLGFGSNGELTDANPAGYATYKKSGFDLNVGLGKEWRKGSTRLQGFYGADAMVGLKSSKLTETGVGADGTYKNGMEVNLSVKGFLGAEYFILPKMSIGAQYNYGLVIASQGASKQTAGGATVSGESNTDVNLGNVGSATMNLTLHF